MEPQNLFTTTPDFLSVKAVPGYFYSERKNRDSVAVFLILNKKVLIRYQPMPQFLQEGRLYACPITGSMEEGYLPLQVAQKEALEEGGYEVDLSSAVDLGYYLVGTQTNEVCWMFAWDVIFLENQLAQGDGTDLEKLAENGWLTFEEALEIAEYSGLVIGLYKLRNRGLL